MPSRPEVQQTHRRWRHTRELGRELRGFRLRFDQALGAQILRAAENVKPPELERRADERLQHGRNAFRIDAELLGAATHFHAGGLELEIGIDADRDLGALAGLACDRGQALELQLGLGVDDDASGDRLLELGGRLSGPGKADLLASDRRRECDAELAARCDIETERCEARDDGGQRLALIA